METIKISKKNYGVTIVESNDSNKINFLSTYDDSDFVFAFKELKKREYKIKMYSFFHAFLT